MSESNQGAEKPKSEGATTSLVSEELKYDQHFVLIARLTKSCSAYPVPLATRLTRSLSLSAAKFLLPAAYFPPAIGLILAGRRTRARRNSHNEPQQRATRVLRFVSILDSNF